jgi:hypothetical protein
MEIRLGQMLVKSGVISPDELDEALKNQVIFGTRLGTSLIELGYLTEQELATFLSRKLQVPAVPADELLRIPQEIISLVPHDRVEKYQVIPYRLDQKRLTVVMADPTDFAAIDELSFITGLIVVPAVSPELGIFRAMEHCYGIRHGKRGINVSPDLKKQARKGRREELVGTPPPTASVTPIPTDDIVEFPPIDEFLGFYREGEPDSVTTSPYSRAFGSYTVDRLSRALAEATDREAIADALIGYCQQEMPVAAIFIVRGNNAVGWRASVHGTPVADFQRISISLSESSVLSLALEGKCPYLGPAAASPANAEILSALAVHDLPTVLTLPVVLMNRVVAILYLGNGIDMLTQRLIELQRLAVKAALSFEILILRNKILLS